MDRRSGFTLVELLVATSMLAMLAAAGYMALAAGSSSGQKARRVGRMLSAAQGALQMMAEDLRSAVAHDEVRLTALDVQYEGLDADTMDFIVPCLADPELGVGGRCEVGYYADNDPATEAQGLARREDGTLDDDPLAGGTGRLLGPLVAELDLRFFDGLDWADGWDDPERFPQAVRISIVVVDPDEAEAPRRFETTVSLPAR